VQRRDAQRPTVRSTAQTDQEDLMADDPKGTKFNKLSAVKSRGKPLGGAPEVKIPPLDADPVTHPDGRPMTMAEQAEILQDPSSPMSPYYTPELPTPAHAQGQGEQMDPRTLRAAREAGQEAGKAVPAPKGPFGGVLPPEAQKDPRFVQGVGSMYADNQPGIKAQRGPGVPGERKLSDETIEGLDALKRFNEQAAENQEKATKETEEKALIKDTAGDLADELGLDKSLLEDLRAAKQDLDTDELREAIEGRCKPLDLVQLIEEGEARQDVPIVKGQFIVTFRTVSGEEDLAVKKEMGGDRGPDLYVFDKLSMMQLTMGVYAINGRVLPDHLNDSKRFDRDKFKRKFKAVSSYPLPMLASLGVNFTWFDQRCRKLFIDLEPLKNG
jgi:hypothetical protein